MVLLYIVIMHGATAADDAALRAGSSGDQGSAYRKSGGILVKKDFFVIFDMDGVIFDSERACFECWMEAADILGVRGMREFYPRIIGTNAAQTLRMARETFDGITGGRDR